jgi:hypothetical protein
MVFLMVNWEKEFPPDLTSFHSTSPIFLNKFGPVHIVTIRGLLLEEAFGVQ